MKLLVLFCLVLVLGSCEQADVDSSTLPVIELPENSTMEESQSAHEDGSNLNLSVKISQVSELPSLGELTSTIDTSMLPSILQGIRFVSSGNQSFTNEVHEESEGRNFPVGHFKAFYLDGRVIEITVDSHRPIYVYELHYAHAYRIAKTIGQLPLEFQSQIRSVTLTERRSTSSSWGNLNNGTISVSTKSLDTMRLQNNAYITLLRMFDLSSLIDDSSWNSLTESGASLNRMQQLNEFNAIYWFIINQEIMQTMNVQLGKPLEQQVNLMLERVSFPSIERIDSYPQLDLPRNNTMNIASLELGEGMIVPSDASSLLDVTFIETATRYYARGVRWTGSLSGPFPAHVFKATYQDGYAMNINVHASVEYSEAERLANDVAFKYGQVPALLLSKMDDFILLPGMGHPYSGRVTTFYVDVLYGMGSHIVQGFMHDMAHASLDWPLENNNKDMYDIKDDQTIIPHQGVTTRSAWLNAASLDNYYVSTYGEDNPEREDIAESIIPYLMLRWRPERFDPYQLQFIEESIPNRIAYFDTFDWGFPNK